MTIRLKVKCGRMNGSLCDERSTKPNSCKWKNKAMLLMSHVRLRSKNGSQSGYFTWILWILWNTHHFFFLFISPDQDFFLCKVIKKGKWFYLWSKVRLSMYACLLWNRTGFVFSETHRSDSEFNSENQKTGNGNEGAVWRWGCGKGQEREGDRKKGERNRGRDGFLRNISSWVASLLL